MVSSMEEFFRVVSVSTMMIMRVVLMAVMIMMILMVMVMAIMIMIKVNGGPDCFLRLKEWLCPRS